MQMSALISAFVALTLFAASLPVYLDVGGVYSQLKIILEGERTVTSTVTETQVCRVKPRKNYRTGGSFTFTGNTGGRMFSNQPDSQYNKGYLGADYSDAWDDRTSYDVDPSATASLAVIQDAADTRYLPPGQRFQTRVRYFMVDGEPRIFAFTGETSSGNRIPTVANLPRFTGCNASSDFPADQSVYARSGAQTLYLSAFDLTTVTSGTRTEVVVDPYLSENPYAGILRALLPLLPVALLVWAFGSIGVVFLSGIGARRWNNSAKF